MALLAMPPVALCMAHPRHGHQQGGVALTGACCSQVSLSRTVSPSGHGVGAAHSQDIVVVTPTHTPRRARLSVQVCLDRTPCC
jgi:hypothetical protein